jgi:hypothetical protein
MGAHDSATSTCESSKLWRGLSPELQALVDLYRQLFPRDPLPRNVQMRAVAEETSHGAS